MASTPAPITKAEQGIADRGTIDRSFPAIVRRLERYAMLRQARGPGLGLVKTGEIQGKVELRLPTSPDFRDSEDRWFGSREKLNEYILLHYPSDRREFEFQIKIGARQWLYRAVRENLRLLEELRKQSLLESGLLDLQMAARMYMDALEAHLQQPSVQTKTSEVAEAFTAEIEFDREIVEQSNNDVLKLLFRSAKGLQHRHLFKSIAKDKEKARSALESLFKLVHEGILGFRRELMSHDNHRERDYFWRYAPAIIAALGDYSHNSSLNWFTLEVIVPEKGRGFFDHPVVQLGLGLLTIAFIVMSIMSGPVGVALAAADSALGEMYNSYIQARRNEMTDRASLFGLGNVLPVEEEHNYWIMGGLIAISLLSGHTAIKISSSGARIATTEAAHAATTPKPQLHPASPPRGAGVGRAAEAGEVTSTPAIKAQSAAAEAPPRTAMSERAMEAKAGSPTETKAPQLEPTTSQGDHMVQKDDARPPIINDGERNLSPIKSEERALQREAAVEETPRATPKTTLSVPSASEKAPSLLTQRQLDDAIEQLEAASYYEAQYPAGSTKTVAHSEGKIDVSGPGLTGKPSDFPQRAAPYGSESEYYVGRYKELSGRDAPAGNDNWVKGDDFATHAEVKNRIHQFDDGTNNATGVSKDMCGKCRLWYQNTAKKQGKQLVTADPHHIRAFNPNGTVDIYTAEGEFIRIVPADMPPAATRRYYEGIDW